MAITLAQAKVGMADKVDQNVIDLVQRESALMNALTWHHHVLSRFFEVSGIV